MHADNNVHLDACLTIKELKWRIQCGTSPFFSAIRLSFVFLWDSQLVWEFLSLTASLCRAQNGFGVVSRRQISVNNLSSTLESLGHCTHKKGIFSRQKIMRLYTIAVCGSRPRLQVNGYRNKSPMYVSAFSTSQCLWHARPHGGEFCAFVANYYYLTNGH